MKGNGGLIGAILGLLGFLLMLAAMATESTDAGDRPSVYNDGLLGHSDWLQLLQRTGQRASVSRQQDTARRLGEGAIHVVAEPQLAHLPDTFPDAPRTLLILPKWRQSRTAAGGLGRVTVPVEDGVHTWLRERLDLPSALTPPIGEDPTERPLRYRPIAGNSFTGAAIEAVVDVPAEPWHEHRRDLLVTRDDRVLAFSLQMGNREVVVVTDPDLVNNHGLRRADNAVVLLALMDALADGRDVEFVFDEAVHGFVGPPGILAALVTPPLSWFAAYLLLAGGVVAWALGRGFGPERAPPVALTGDSASLVHSAANLMGATGPPASALARYRRARERTVARAFHVRAREPDDIRTELRRLGRARQRPFPEPSPSAGIHDARAVDRWCHDILDGHPRSR